MLLSMTGYGASTTEIDHQKIKIEIKSINSKMADVRLKIPSKFNSLELDLRKMTIAHVHRGKVDVNIQCINTDGNDDFSINIPLFKNYYKEISSALDEMNMPKEELASGILRINNVIGQKTSEITADEKNILFECFQHALDQLKLYRIEDAKKTKEEFESNVTTILSALEDVENYDAKRIEKIKERIEKKFEELNTKYDLDESRMEQELLYYMEKLDFSEEKSRLSQHCNYFLKVLMEQKEVKGKTLNFISQEMGREINTLGSKANDFNVQSLVVKMKDELEKIKEQLANVV